MCTTCGCGGHDATIEGKGVYRHAHEHTLAEDIAHAHPDDAHGHFHADGTWHSHAHAAPHAGPLGAVHAPGTPEARIVEVEADLLAKNDALAAANRRLLAARGIFALNLVSSPGSGKTTLLVRTIEAWGRRSPVAVIEGDQQTSQRRRPHPRHRRARRAGQHRQGLPPRRDDGRACARRARPAAWESSLFIENVGNLVCPAAFDLGEAPRW